MTKRPTYSLAFLLLLLCCSCKAQQVRYSADFAVSASNFADSIEIEWTNEQVYVPVDIEGQTYRFLIDTGSSQMVVYEDSPFLNHCGEAGFMLAHDANGRTDSVSILTMPTIRLGRLALTGCRATLHRRAVTGRDFDGIIGFDIVNRGLSMKIDVDRRLLVLTDRRDFFDDEEGFDVKYRLNYHVPYVEINPFGSHTDWARFDTGSRQFYSINKQSFDHGESLLSQPLGAQVEGRCTGRYAIGNYGAEPRCEVVFLALERMRMGRFTFTDVHAVTTQGGSHLGAKVLEQGAVVFNPRRKRMRFEPYEEGNTCHVGNEQMEIAFVAERGMPVVGLVWEQGEPYRCGFREGDMVVAIDGRPVRSASQFYGWGFEPGRAYRFTLRDRDGRQRTAEWVRLPK